MRMKIIRVNVKGQEAAMRILGNLAIAILLALIIATAATGEEIQGVVKEALSGKPLPGANVMIKGTSFGAVTNLDGRYVILNVPPGSYQLVFRYIGFDEFRTSIVVREGQSSLQDANLNATVLSGPSVKVTAQRQGQVAAINRQLTAKSIINVVSAERIQELPDVNASESVGRLPGISIIREGGEGQKIVIRGLAPQYNTITVGGEKIPSNDLADRSIDMSMISSDMLAGIELIKAITPDRDADAFGGIVDFQVAKAADGGFKSNVRLQSGYNSIASEYGQYKNSIRMSQRFFENRLGVLVTGNMENTNRSADIFNANYSVERERRPGETYAPIRINSLTLEDRIEQLNRYGANLMIDYRFDKGELVFSNFLSRVHRDRMVNERDMDPGTNNDNSYNLEVNDISKEIFTSSVSGKYRLPFVNIDARMSVNQGLQVRPYDYLFEFTEGGAFDQVVYNQNKEELGPDAILLAAKNNYTDSGINGGELSNAKSKERDLTAQLNMEIPYKLFGNNITGAIKMGGKVANKNRLTEEAEFMARLYQERDSWIKFQRHHTRYGTPGFVYKSISTSNSPSVVNYIDPGYDAGNFLDGAYEFGIGLDRNELIHLAKSFLVDSLFDRDELSGLDDFDTRERVSAGYIMTEINLGPRLMLIPGVRYEDTYIKFTSKSSNISEKEIEREGTVSDTSATTQYGRWFPMMHVHYKLTDWFDIRLAGTRTYSRPRMDWLNPRVKKSATSMNMNRGIIDLKPQLSNNFDLFLSLHSFRLGLLTLGGFYKKIEDLIWLRNDMRIYKKDIDAGLFPADYKGFAITQPENNPNDTELWGFETEWQTNFSWLPKPLNGLVLNLNYSHIWSETKYPFSLNRTLKVPPFTSSRIDTFRTGPMPNQASDIANLAIGYDLKGFSARLSMLYQGKTLRSLGNREEIDGYTDDLVRWDFMIKQNINQWMSVFGNWNNITNAADLSYIQAVQYADEREYYGWTADIGLMFKF